MKDTLENELQQATAWAEDVRDRRERISRRADAFQREHDTLMDKRDELVSERESALREFAEGRAALPWVQIEEIDGQLRVIDRRTASLETLLGFIDKKLQATKGELSGKELENMPASKRYATLCAQVDITRPHLDKIIGRTML